MNQVLFKDLGSMDYKDAWDYQNELFQGIIDIKLSNRKKEIPFCFNCASLRRRFERSPLLPNVYTGGCSVNKK